MLSSHRVFVCGYGSSWICRSASSMTPRQCAKFMRVLEIDGGPEVLTREVLRRQYIAMVKKYHPDTAAEEQATMDKFLEVDEVPDFRQKQKTWNNLQ